MTDEDFSKEVEEFRRMSDPRAEALRIIKGMRDDGVFEKLPYDSSQRLMEWLEHWQGFAGALDWLGDNKQRTEVSLVSWRATLEGAGVLKKEERLK